MSRTGRPREFDRDKAIESAMQLFWAQGYEGTTLADLQKAMGDITAPSFYAAFGSKEALFREVVELYKKTQGAPVIKAFSEGATARASIEAMLQAAARSVCSHGNPRGCMMLVSINCTAANKGVEDFLREQRVFRDKLIKQRLQKGIADGDLPASTDVNNLISFYSSIIDGMAVQARDGLSRNKLNSIAKNAMAAWDIVVRSEEAEKIA
jgi:AcrR family transcriptional regulator